MSQEHAKQKHHWSTQQKP